MISTICYTLIYRLKYKLKYITIINTYIQDIINNTLFRYICYVQIYYRLIIMLSYNIVIEYYRIRLLNLVYTKSLLLAYKLCVIMIYLYNI